MPAFCQMCRRNLHQCDTCHPEHEVEGPHTPVRTDEPPRGILPMLSTAGRKLPAGSVSCSTGAGSFDSANTTLREAFAALRMTLWVVCAACPAAFARREQRTPTPTPSNTCHPEGGGSLATRAIRNRRIYAFGSLYPVWVRTDPQWAQSSAAMSRRFFETWEGSPQNHPVLLCAPCGKDFDLSVPIRSL